MFLANKYGEENLVRVFKSADKFEEIIGKSVDETAEEWLKYLGMDETHE